MGAVDGSSTLLFDEIDSGVSGRVSGAMAVLLRNLGEQRQVFCVTHQPLVAAVADHHFRVNKEVKEGVTYSRVSRLRDTRERQQELRLRPQSLQGICTAQQERHSHLQLGPFGSR